MLVKLILFAYVLFQQGSESSSDGGILIDGGNLNLTNLSPNVTFITTTSLYSSEINILFAVFLRSYPYNHTLNQTIKVLSGNTTINSTNRCITFGESFNLWNEVPIRYPHETGNGGCDALWGKKCSQNILTAIQNTRFDDINDRFCGVRVPRIYVKQISGCPTTSLLRSSSLRTFYRNGTFILGRGPPPMNLSKPWIRYESYPSVDGNYDIHMKRFVFTYFVGREYTSSKSDVAIACMSFYNSTMSSGIKGMQPEHFLITLLLMIIFVSIH